MNGIVFALMGRSLFYSSTNCVKDKGRYKRGPALSKAEGFGNEKEKISYGLDPRKRCVDIHLPRIFIQLGKLGS